MSPSLVLSLREGVSLATEPQGYLILRSEDTQFVFRQLTEGVSAALQRLGTTGGTEACLADIVQMEGIAALAKWHYYLQLLSQRGLVQLSANLNRTRLATLTPTSAFSVYPSREIALDHQYVLSRFAYARRVGGESILESPLSQGKITIHDWSAAALVHALRRPLRADAVAGLIPGLPTGVVEQLLTLLATSNMLDELADDGTDAETSSPALKYWEFHDLLFHTRTRQGRHDNPAGATYRFAGELDPPLSVKPPFTDDVIDLFRPNLDQLRRDDPPFAQVQEMRESVRHYGDQPITVKQLGEFLYRVGRVNTSAEYEVNTPRGPVRTTYTSRPYPDAGGLYELELYAAVNACEGLPAGLYHYDPLYHRLERVCGWTEDVAHLMRDTSYGTGNTSENLQVLLIIATRLPRVGWKYASIAYALTLKHVGVLYQTMYLVATAMNLAPCAIGCGNSDLFARSAGTNYLEETSVGEFLLGSRR